MRHTFKANFFANPSDTLLDCLFFAQIISDSLIFCPNKVLIPLMDQMYLSLSVTIDLLFLTFPLAPYKALLGHDKPAQNAETAIC